MRTGVKLLGGLMVVAMWCATERANALTTSWNVGAGSWTNNASWTSNTPTGGDVANVDTGGTATIDTDGATCTNLTLGSGSAKTGTVNMTAGTLTVGNNATLGLSGGLGIFNQSGGTNIATVYLMLGKGTGGTGYYQLSGGLVRASPLYVGWGGYGQFDISGGTLLVQGGTSMHLGTGSIGLFVQSNGLVNASAGISIGDSGATGTYLLVNGTLLSQNNTWLGAGGVARVRMTGGSWIVYGQDMYVGYNSRCVFEAVAGTLMLSNTWYKTLHVGSSGDGALYLGDSNSTAVVTNVPQASFGGSLSVRDTAGAVGLVRGWGQVGFMGTLLNNGQIIADGYGTARDLDMSLFGKFGAVTPVAVTNSIENTSSNGWFAVSKGRLMLPPLAVSSNAGTVAYTWGESVTDTNLDLVNSACLTLNNPSSGSITGALLAVDRTDGPETPAGATFIGWGRSRAAGSPPRLLRCATMTRPRRRRESRNRTSLACATRDRAG
jgi:hypothetical protein